MFDSVLHVSGAPPRRLGTGVAFAVAAHLWLLVLAVAHPREAPPRAERSEVAVMFVPSVNLPPGPPPPAGGGGAPRKANTGVRSKPLSIAVPSPDALPPAHAPEPAEAPEQGTTPGGGGEGGGGGGDGGGGTGMAGGVPGGTGTAPAGGPPPTFRELHLGDEGLDQTTCEISGAPPYPKEAAAQKIEGLVIASCTVDPSGSLSGCKVLKAPYSFETTVNAFLAGAHARPFTARGKPVSVRCNFSFRYKLSE